ncbi:phosphotransferase [Trichophyton tonsurans CBS 112818]|uniref:Altered inheritance of mitochondria protein 9, mitochondrial n=2 Tax=Trichophyton TaxID=5550 RepID=F2Q2N2_TRIEC|nr:phosphotransferase [Trichophyton tonsurans CBS 112818]EGE08400.1 phosphotransferase enzyme family protein [Trichophyton equinum CBS 127.97]
MSTPQSHNASNWDDESFHRYTGGRWLYNEDKQMADRSVRFNMTELVRAAAISQGCDISSCIKVEKLPEGDYNKVFLISLHGGHQVVAKVPNKNAGLPFYTTASEVATMNFGRNVAGLPIPKVYAWNPHTSDNDVGAEYIIMEKAKGVLLSSTWPSMKKDQKINLINSVISLEKSLLTHHFQHIGSLYHKSDLDGVQDRNKFFDTSYGDFVVGPKNSALEYILASSMRERECIVRGLRFPRPEGIFGGPGGYKPTAKSKLDVLDDFEKVAAYLLPKDTSVHIPVLWHGDLHDNNIFVDPDDPSKILSIIDWQTTHIAPLFQQARTPEFLDFIGPHPSLGLTPMPPLPDNFDSLSAAEKEEAKALQSKQSLFKIYEIQSGRNNMPVFKALQHSQTLGTQIISLISQVFNDGEPIIKGQLIQLALDWEKVVGPNGPPCPLQFTEADIAAQRVDQQKWEEGVQMKGDVLEALGGAEHGWAGWSSHEDYDVLTKKLAIVKEQFLDYMANNEAEKEAWENVWPYRDD